jgi:hypothetical protein
MSRRTTLQHTLVATLAAGALVASPALARPTDRVDRFDSRTSSLAGTASPRQDRRGEHARDAARAAEMQVPAGLPTWPVDPEPIVKPEQKVLPAETGGDDEVWLFIGLAAAGIGAGVTAGVTRYRVRARRVAA